ncbi:MAG: choice-of-anchor I family protein, partial [Pirellulaceae bacterium]|nr:choice-of-anchor I family protein [Pirellulaceae bacterium]
AVLEGGTSAYTYVGRQAGADGGDQLLATAATVNVNSGGKLFGLFGGAGGNFEYHVATDTPGAPSITQGSQENPTLAETVQASLDVLGDDPQGFFVMFEQGDIDWANHANDFENMIGGMWDLDQAVRAAEVAVAAGVGGMDWSNTLLIVTSDHSNSYLRQQRVLGAGNLPAQTPAGGSYTYPDGSVTYSTGGHTNELVTVSARGAGADLFDQYAGDWYPGTGIIDNSHIYQVMKQAALTGGVQHVILFIGDGMNLEHEIAGSRYLYGTDAGLAWHNWGLLDDGWAGFCSTWDVTTYNKYAQAQGAPAYNAASFDPLVGYDPARGGDQSLPLVQVGEFMPLTAKTLEQHTADQLAALNIKPVAKTKLLNLPSLGYLPNDKPEGLTVLPGGRLAVINDNDFALAGPVPISLGVISFAAGNTLDASDRDGPAINLANWPVYGTYMPDAVASFASGGQTFYITANEGDDRGENARVKDLKLDAGVFPNATDLKKDAQIGRLNVSKNEGDLDGDGDYDQLWAYGARSFSIWDAYGNLVFDSGDQLEAITAAQTPALFNADNGNPADFDTRSDNKGPEPEAVTIGVIDGRTYAFVGIERSGGGVFVYDVTNPQAPQFIQYVRMDGDVGPESLSFIAADSSPNGRPLLVVANEVSHTATIYEIDDPAPVVRAEGRFGGNLTIRRQNYTSGGRDFADLQVIDSRTGAVLLDQPLAATQSLHVIGTNLRADLFTVDFAFGGNFVLPDGLHFDSGTWRRASDAVRIQGTAGDDLFSLQGPTGQFNGLDVMLGDVASVTLEGGAGDDIYRFHSSSADVTVQDTAGVDLLDFSPAEGGVRIDLRRSTGAPQRMPWRNSLALRGTIEAVIGSEFADWIMGNTADNRIWGRGGNDAIFGNDGNDWVWGGDGDDSLYGDRGQDVLLGEAGNDYISGGHDRDLLIGGTGSDRLYGGWDDDLLVAGTTAHDGDDQALAAIMAEWATPTPAATRVGHLQAGVGPAGAVKLVRGETVFDDGDPDWLWGESGDDWCLLFTGDAAIGRGPGDL